MNGGTRAGCDLRGLDAWCVVGAVHWTIALQARPMASRVAVFSCITREGPVAAEAEASGSRRRSAQPAGDGVGELGEGAHGGGGAGDVGDGGPAALLTWSRPAARSGARRNSSSRTAASTRRCWPLAEVRGHGVGGVAEQDEAAVDPLSTFDATRTRLRIRSSKLRTAASRGIDAGIGAGPHRAQTFEVALLDRATAGACPRRRRSRCRPSTAKLPKIRAGPRLDALGRVDVDEARRYWDAGRALAGVEAAGGATLPRMHAVGADDEVGAVFDGAAVDAGGRGRRAR